MQGKQEMAPQSKYISTNMKSGKLVNMKHTH